MYYCRRPLSFRCMEHRQHQHCAAVPSCCGSPLRLPSRCFATTRNSPLLLQRFQPSARRSARRPSAVSTSSSPTFRSPTLNLLSPFGSVLHGPTRAATADFAEPLDAWLAVLADTVPFYKDCLLICPSTSTAAQVQRVWDRCREHIPTAHVGALRPRTKVVAGQRSASTMASSTSTTTAGVLPPSASSSSSSTPCATASASHASTTAAPQTGGGDAPLLSSSVIPVAAPSRHLPALHSPLEDVAPNSLDLVVLARNVFAHEMLFDAPWHLSLAHRALRPHGVIAILGHVVEVDVAAPDWGRESCAECRASVYEEATHDLTLAAAAPALPSTAPHVQRLRRALEMHETLRTAHGDVFFPFPAVRRRWFTSEYAVTPAQAVAGCRADPLYQALHSPAGATWRRQAAYAAEEEAKRHLRQSAPSDPSAPRDTVGAEDDFFVDLTPPELFEVSAGHHLRSGSLPSLPGDASPVEAAAAAWSPLGVQRRRGPVDPLDALQAFLEAHSQHALHGSSGGGRGNTRRPPRAAPPSLRVQMRHFVVTCSSRSINATRDEPTPQLRGRGGRGDNAPLLSSREK